MKWISIKDQIPDSDEEIVLGAHDKLSGYAPTLCYYDQELKGFLPICGDTTFIMEVTHWMNIPLLSGEGSPKV